MVTGLLEGHYVHCSCRGEQVSLDCYIILYYVVHFHEHHLSCWSFLMWGAFQLSEFLRKFLSHLWYVGNLWNLAFEAKDHSICKFSWTSRSYQCLWPCWIVWLSMLIERFSLCLTYDDRVGVAHKDSPGYGRCVQLSHLQRNAGIVVWTYFENQDRDVWFFRELSFQACCTL